MDPNRQAQQASQEWFQRFVRRAHSEQGLSASAPPVGCRIFLAIVVVGLLAFIGLLAFYVLFMVHPG